MSSHVSCLKWSTSYSDHFILSYMTSFNIGLTWTTFPYCHFNLAYMTYFHLEPFHLSDIKCSQLGQFNFTLHEVFSYRAVSFFLHQVSCQSGQFIFPYMKYFHIEPFHLFYIEYLKTRSTSFYLTWSIFIMSNFICFTSSTCHSDISI